MMIMRNPGRGVRQFFRFGLVGGLNTAIDVGIFVLLVHYAAWPTIAAQSVSYAGGLCNSFVMNRWFTFRVRRRPHSGQILIFIIVNVVSYCLSVGILAGLAALGAPLWLQKGGATLVALVVNFSGNRLWVFKEEASSRDPRFS